ncbi:MAG: DUF5006 domain-containing protein [Rikenellaceae bacterium]
MKKIFYLSFLAAALVGCSDDPETTTGDEGTTTSTAIELTVGDTALLTGETVELTFALAEGTATEDINITFTATTTAVDDVNTLFDEMPESLTIASGTSSVTGSFTVADDELESTASFILTLYARGYTIAASPITYTIQNAIYSSVVVTGIATGIVDEGGKFTLTASVATAAQEDVVIAIDADDASLFENLPSSLTIVAGETSVVSESITAVDNDDYVATDPTATLTLSTDSEIHPLSSETLVITIKENDTPLGSTITDERHVYDDPSIMFVSSGKESGVQSWTEQEYVLMSRGDAHPKLTGWTFQTALEFHRSMGIYNSTYDTYSVNCVAAHSVANTQTYAGINNNQFATVTDQGYLNMWMMKIATARTTDTATMDYGASAFYSSGFGDSEGAAAQWATHCMRIHEGTRIETRARITGEKKGFNFAIWLVGSKYANTAWPEYGEVDIMENPASTSDNHIYHGTFHFGALDSNYSQGYGGHVTGNTSALDMTEWNIYWCEIRSSTEIAVGVNGETIAVAKKEDVGSDVTWPYCDSYNLGGFRYLLTMGAPSTWSLGGDVYDGWDSGFASYIDYFNDRFNTSIPRMEIDFVRVYENENFTKSSYSIIETYSY